MANTEGRKYPTITIAGQEFAILQAASMVGGFGFLASYVLPWIDIVGPVFHEDDINEPICLTEEQVGQVEETQPEVAELVVREGTISAREVAILPELIAVLGVVAFGVALFTWNRWSHLFITAVGLAGTGVVLYLRELLGSDSVCFEEVGSYIGYGSSFDPGIGLWIVFGISALLIGVGFGAFLNTFEE